MSVTLSPLEKKSVHFGQIMNLFLYRPKSHKFYVSNIFEILMYLLLYTCSFCCFFCSGNPHRIVPAMNPHIVELENPALLFGCPVVQADWPFCILGDKLSAQMPLESTNVERSILLKNCNSGC